MYSSVIEGGALDKYLNTGQTCFMEFNTFYAVFFLMPQNDETVSQPPNACRNKIPFDKCSPSYCAISCAEKYLNVQMPTTFLFVDNLI